MIVIATDCQGRTVDLNLFNLVYAIDDEQAGCLQVQLSKGSVHNLPTDQPAVEHIREYAALRYKAGLLELERMKEELS